MNLGAMIHSTTGFGENDKRPFHEGVKMVAEAGFDNISFLSWPGGYVLNDAADQLPCTLIDIVNSNPSALKQVVQDNGLEMVHMHGGDFVTEDDTSTLRSVEEVKGIVDAAHRLGLHYISSGVSFKDWTNEEEKRPYHDRLIQALNLVAEYIGTADLRLGLDIHCHSCLETLNDCRYVLDRVASPKTGLCLNMGHLNTLDQEGWRLVYEYPERIVVAAWKDHINTGPKDFRSVRMGGGSTPFNRYRDAFATVKTPAHHIHSFEFEAWEEKAEALAESYRYWQQLWSNEGLKKAE